MKKLMLQRIECVISPNKQLSGLTNTKYVVTKETEKMYFLEDLDTKRSTKQLKPVLGAIKEENITPSYIKLSTWCLEANKSEVKQEILNHAKDIITDMEKDILAMSSQLK